MDECRCCLQQFSTPRQLKNMNLVEKPFSVPIKELFFELTSISLKKTTTKICSSCLTKLKEAHEFKDLCIRSDMQLKMRVAEVEANKIDLDPPTMDFSVEPKVEMTLDPDIQIKVEEKEEEIKIEPLVVNVEKKPSKLRKKRKRSKLTESTKRWRNVFNTIKRRKSKLATAKTGSEEADKIAKDIAELEAELATLPMPKRGKPKKEKDTYICDLCSKVFHARHEIVNHLHSKMHFNVRNFVCPVCGVAFSISTTLNDHIMSAHGEKKFVCETCGARFPLKSTLARHVKGHLRPFKCQEPGCGKDYRTKPGLVTHLRKHSGERPFGCHICFSQFSDRSHLIRHLKLHAGFRYYCKFCPDSFTNQYLWRVHNIERHGITDRQEMKNGRGYAS